jgi:hypothetical protein
MNKNINNHGDILNKKNILILTHKPLFSMDMSIACKDTRVLGYCTEFRTHWMRMDGIQCRQVSILKDCGAIDDSDKLR